MCEWVKRVATALPCGMYRISFLMGQFYTVGSAAPQVCIGSCLHQRLPTMLHTQPCVAYLMQSLLKPTCRMSCTPPEGRPTATSTNGHMRGIYITGPFTPPLSVYRR